MKAIRMYRERAGLTQAQLADLAGVHQHHISRWERGHHEIGGTNLCKVAEALNMLPWELTYAEQLLERREAVEEAVEGFALAV